MTLEISYLDEADFEQAINNSFFLRDLGQIYKFDSEVLKKKFNTLSVEERNREILKIQRAKLQSSNGDTVQAYDQFYRDHKLMLVLFRVLAVMPVIRDGPGKISFKWHSFATYYAIGFWSMMTFVVLVIGRERIKILMNITEFDEYIYAVIFVIFLVPHFWIPFVGWGVAKEVANYKTSWGPFQLRYFRVTGTGLQFPDLKLLILVISIACLICAIVFLMALSLLLDGFPMWHTVAYYHIVIMINMNCALWYVNTRGLKVASKSLGERFRIDVEVDKSAALISQYRFLWLNLSEIVQLLGNAYARTYSTYLIFLFVNICIAVYGTFSDVFENGLTLSFKQLGLIVDAVYCSVLLFVFCDCSHKSTLEVAKGVQNTLLALDMMSLDTQAKKEVDLFILAIEMNPAVVSLRGYVEVNRELLTSYIAMIAIYLLVLIQFKFSLVKAKKAE